MLALARYAGPPGCSDKCEVSPVSTPAEQSADSPSEMLDAIRLGLDQIYSIVTDPCLHAAMQALDDGPTRVSAVGHAFRQTSSHAESPSQMRWRSTSACRRTPGPIGAFRRRHGRVRHPAHVGVYHNSSGWHWGC